MAEQTVIRVERVVTGDPSGRILENHSIIVEGSRIRAIVPSGEIPPGVPSVDATRCVAIPGFIQTHVHLCQTLFRGLAEDLELLDWLRKKIFPLEAAHDERSVYASAMIGIAELIRSGTTTVLDMGTLRHEEEIVRAVGETGLRAFLGKAMMDVNDAYPKLKESSRESLESTRRLAERWHGSYGGRVRYAVAPRFVLSCTDGLLKDAREMTASFDGMLFHTHASENKAEIEAVRKRCRMENIEFLHHLGVLSRGSVLAHCVHVNPREVEILRSTGTAVAHCPSSNLKLGSGIAPVPLYQSGGITVTLGADGAPCNNTMNMFMEMRLASLLQKPVHGPLAMPAKLLFEMATSNGARALGLGDEIGALEPGKKADIVLLDLHDLWNPLDGGGDIFSAIVYSAGPENVDSVMVDGSWVYRKKEFTGIDRERLLSEGGAQLESLLSRVE